MEWEGKGGKWEGRREEVGREKKERKQKKRCSSNKGLIPLLQVFTDKSKS